MVCVEWPFGSRMTNQSDVTMDYGLGPWNYLLEYTCTQPSPPPHTHIHINTHRVLPIWGSGRGIPASRAYPHTSRGVPPKML